MKKLLLLVLIILSSCGKRNDNKPNSDCGVIVMFSRRTDGGIEESFRYKGCGLDFSNYIKNNNFSTPMPDFGIFYKYDERPKTTYLIVTLNSGGNLYIRYDSGKVPDSTINKYNVSYRTSVQTISGIERFGL